MMFITFSVLFVVSVAAINDGTYPVQREDFHKMPMPQHQPSGIYRVSRNDFIGVPQFMSYPYNPYYPGPRTYYWNPPRSYDYRSHDSRRPVTPELPRLFVPHIPKTPVVTRKPTPPDFNDYDDILPATRGPSPSDESEPLAAVPVTFKRTSKQPDEYYVYNDDVEITAEQRDLLVGFNRARTAETKETQKQADRFRRQAIFVLEATAEDIRESAEDHPLYLAAVVGSNDDQKILTSDDADLSDEFQYPAFYESMKRTKNNYLENNEIMDDEDNLSNQYSTQSPTTSEFPTEQVTSSTPAVDSDEDIVVIYEQQEIMISSNADLPESVADPDVDYELKEDKSSEIRESSTPEDVNLDAEFRDILEKLILSMPEGANQQGEFSQGQSSDDKDDTIMGLSRSPYDYYEILETATMAEEINEVDSGTEENSPDIVLDSTTITPIDTTTSEDWSFDYVDSYDLLSRILAGKSSTSTPIDATLNIDLLVSLLNEELNKESSTSTPVDIIIVINGEDLPDTNLMGFVNDQRNKNFGILKQFDNGTLIYKPYAQSTSTETSINDFEPEEEIDDFNTNSLENTESPTTTQNEDVVYGGGVSSAEMKEIILKELSSINLNIGDTSDHWRDETVEYDDESV